MHQPSSGRTQSRSASLISIVAAFVFLTGMNAGAQVMEEVIVTAQKREQNVQDVGIAVTALSGDQLTALGYSNAPMVVDMAPGVQIVQPNSVSSYSFAIRGVIQTDFADHQEPPVSLYVDEAYISQTSGAGFQLFDLERVEILRGPQGTLYGRNATGGTVQFVTKKPSQEFDAYMEGKFGSWGQKGFEAAVGGGLTESISARVSASGNTHDPFVRNRVGPDLFDGNEWAVRAQVLFEVNDDVRLLINGRGAAMEVRVGGADTEASSYNPANFFGVERAETEATTNPVVGDPAAGTIGSVDCAGCDYFGFNEPDENPFTISHDHIGFNDLATYGGGARLEWDFENFDFVSISDWYHIDKEYQGDSDNGPVTAVNFFLANNVEQFTQEIRFNGEMENFRWLAGFYYMQIRGEYGTGFQAQSPLATVAGGGGLPADALVGAFGPDVPCFGFFPKTADLLGTTCGPQPTSHGPGDITLQLIWEQNTTSYSLFGQTEFDLLPQLTLITGFRWIEEQKELNYQENIVMFNETIPDGRNRLRSDDVAGVLYVFSEDSAGTLATYNRGLWSAKVGLEWDVSDDLLAYFTWNRGVKGGGFNAPLEGQGLRPEQYPFKEEILIAYEAGFKQRLYEGKIRVNGAAFYYDYDDFQAFIVEGLSQIVLNKDAVIYGAELDIQGSPWRGLDLVGGIAYLNTTVEDVNFAADGLPPNPIDREAPRSPKWAINGLVRYQFQPIFKDTFFAGHFALQADFNYRSDFNFLLTNAPVGEQPGYVIGNTRGSYTSEDGRWEAAIAVKNIADQYYTTQVFDIGVAFNNKQLFFDRPRWVIGTVRINF